jgi:hypothetical protein
VDIDLEPAQQMTKLVDLGHRSLGRVLVDAAAEMAAIVEGLVLQTLNSGDSGRLLDRPLAAG